MGVLLLTGLFAHRAMGQETENPLLGEDPPIATNGPELSPWEFGLGFGMQWNAHAADFTWIPGIPTCSPGYDGGSSISASLGLFGGYRVVEDGFVELSLLYARNGATLSTSEEEVVFNGTEGVNATFQHTIDASLGSILLSPLFRYYLTENLSVAGGPTARIVVSGSVVQNERIVEPAGILFENDQRNRLGYDGPIPGLHRLGVGGRLGARYELVLEGLDPIRPAFSLSGSFMPGDLVENVDWQGHAVRLGVDLLWRPRVEEEKTLGSPLDPPLEEEKELEDRSGPRGS